MVKPPKTMQPESVDLTKAGRKSGRAFQADSFHNYMARKIDLHRSQFGVLLPPPPTTTNNTAASVATTSNHDDDTDGNTSPSSPSRRSPASSRKRPRPTAPGKSVSFAMLQFAQPEAKPEQESDNPHSMSSILKKLQRRHGRGSRFVLHKQKRRRARLQQGWHDEEQLFQTDESLEREQDLDVLVDSPDQSIPNKQEDDVAMNQAPDQVNDTTTTSKSPSSQGPLHASIPPNSDDNPTPLSVSKIRRDRPDLFLLGVVVKVNGYTNPDNETIKRLVQRHGGDFETYETERVTHIIAERLSTAKAKFLKQQRRPRPVVSPTWILDCIQAERLLPHGDYLLPEFKDREANQPGIKSLFALETKPRESFTVLSTPPTTTSRTRVHDWNKNESCARALWREDGMTTDEGNSSPDRPATVDDHVQHDRPTMVLLTQAQGMSNSKQRQYSDAKTKSSYHALELIVPTSPKPCTNAEIGNGNFAAKTSPSRQGSDHAPILDKPFSEETNVNAKTGTSPQHEKSIGRTDSKYINGKIRTVGTDPNFLDSFFANSRLSFIGSYRQRTSSDKTSATNLNITDPKSMDNCKRYVFHIDMDCFFANVVLRKYPQYRDKPVAISHHGKKNGDHPPGMDNLMGVSENSTSECATCNYHARQFGIKKGMFLGRARQLCPDLVVLQYDFAGYEEVSEQVLSILHRIAAEYHGCVEPVSCDEAYMELYLPHIVDSKDSIQTTNPSSKHAGDIAEYVRQEILETTECTASIGVAENKLLAKVGTDRVKPNGTFVVTDYREVLKSLRLRDLHGIGYRSEPKLSAEGLVTVQDVWDLGSRGETILSNILGPGLGKKIHSFCCGRDDRQVKPAERKTIGAECSYGVRFDGPYGIDHFMNGLANEVAKRMEGVGCKGCKMTLKVKQRKKDAKPPPKFLGHGSCHNLSKSMDLPDSIPTRDPAIFSEIGMTLFRELAVAVDDVRGMGMIISKLCPDDGANNSTNRRGGTAGIATFFRNSASISSNPPMPTGPEPINSDTVEIGDDASIQGHQDPEAMDGSMEGNSSPIQDSHTHEENVLNISSPGMLALPPLSQICMSQVAALPLDLQEEIQARLADRKKESFPCLDALESPPPNDVEIDTESNVPPQPKGFDPFKNIIGQEKPGFRQTNLKRMMKLAAVKSGQGLEGVSLTQLQKLPLEIQLQIANEDSDPLGLLSQKPRSSLATRPVKSRQATARNGGLPEKQKQGTRVTIEVDSADDSDYDLAKDDREPKHDDMDCAIEHTLAISTDLFEDDIVPLHHFLDANSPVNSEAVDFVIDFFRTCLEERRMNVVPALVRSIKSRSDPWSAPSVLCDIVHGVDEHHFKMYSSRLDTQWLLRD